MFKEDSAFFYPRSTADLVAAIVLHPPADADHVCIEREEDSLSPYRKPPKARPSSKAHGELPEEAKSEDRDKAQDLP